MHYRALSWGALALSVACWAVVTGLSIEKVLVDGVQSWTLLAAMPVFVAAVAVLIHLAIEDLRSGKFARSGIGLALAALTFGVTLPNSIGSAGSAKDTAVAQAEASNRGLTFSESMLMKAEKDLDDAKLGVARECEGAPEKIEGTKWPKCQWWRRQVAAHTLSVEKYGAGLTTAPAEKKPLSGETRIAYALSGIGAKLPEQLRFSVTEEAMLMVLPILPPVAGEFLCAFFGFFFFEFRKLALAAKAEAEPRPVMVPEQIEPVEEPPQIEEETQVTAIDPQPVIIDTSTDPVPPKGGRKPTKKQQRRSKVENWVREYTLQNGHPPAFRVVAGRFHLPDATASRYRKRALDSLAA